MLYVTMANKRPYFRQPCRAAQIFSVSVSFSVQLQDDKLSVSLSYEMAVNRRDVQIFNILSLIKSPNGGGQDLWPNI